MNNSCNINGTRGNLETFGGGTLSLQHILWLHTPEMSIIQMILNQHKTFTKHQSVKSSSLADHKRAELTKNALTDSTLLHSRFRQLFTLQHRAEGLNLLTHTKSHFGRSVLGFFLFWVPGESSGSKYWL